MIFCASLRRLNILNQTHAHDLWLHTAHRAVNIRYKTTLCNLGEKCNREICFFAHSHKDLRTPEPEPGTDATPAAAAGVSGVALSGGSFTAGAAPGAAALGLMTGTGEVVQLSGGSFSSRTGGGIASAASGLLSPSGGGGGGLMLLQQVEQSAGSGLDQQQQQQLLLMQLNSQQQQHQMSLQQQRQQQVMALDSSTAGAGEFQGVEASGPSGGFLSRVLTGNGRGSMQQPAISRQDLCNFDSFTSQGSFSGRQAASLQQQQQQAAMTLRQDLSGFDSFTSQGSFSAAAGGGSFTAGGAGNSFTAATGGGSFTAGSSAAAAMLQQQQQQAAAAALRQELAHFGDSFTNQGSFSAGAGGSFTAGAGNSFSAGNAGGAFGAGAAGSFTVSGSGGSFTAGGGPGSFTVNGSGGSFTAGGRGLALQQQELANFGDSFTSQGSRSIASLQQQAMLLRQELTGYDSVTSQSSFSTTGGGSFTRAAAPGAALLQQQPPILDGAFDSFTSQCSTSSQVLGPGYRSMPLSPLMDRSQGSAGMPGSQVFAALTGQTQTGQAGQVLPRVQAAPSPPGGANAASMLFPGMGQGGAVGSAGSGNGGSVSAMLPPSGAGGRRSLDAGSMLALACAAPGGPTSSNLQQQQQLAAKQQQEAAAVAVQQQVMQLQLHAPDWQQ
jgi:hypothetical protein